MSRPFARIVLRPRTALQSADFAIGFVRAHAMPVVRLAVPVLCFTLTLVLVVRHVLALDWLWTWTLALVVSQLAEAPFTHLFGRLALEPVASARQAIEGTLRDLVPWLFWTLVVSGLTTAGTFLFLVGAPVVGASTLHLPEVLLLERSGWRVLGRTQRLVEGQLGRGMALWSILWTGRVFAMLAAEIALRMLLGPVLQLRFAFDTLESDGGSVFGVAGLIAVAPWVAAVRFVGYVDGRTLREGWDLQRRFQALAEGNAR